MADRPIEFKGVPPGHTFRPLSALKTLTVSSDETIDGLLYVVTSVYDIMTGALLRQQKTLAHLVKG